MIEFSFKGVKVRFTFWFFAVVTVMLLIDKTGLSLMGLAACMLHELGHLLAFFLVGHTPKEISFEASGIRLVKTSSLLCYPKELLVLLAGSAANLVLSLAFYRLLPTPGGMLFAAVHLVLGLFNLLPVGALDGGRIVKLLLLLFCAPDRADKISRAISLLVVLPLAAGSLWLFFSSHNITLLITCAYLILLLLFQSSD